jgi:hypothetical protein
LNLTGAQRAILLTLLEAKHRTGSALATMPQLVTMLRIPQDQIERECEDLAVIHYATCSPSPGRPELVALTINGVRAAQRLYEPDRRLA